MVSLRYDELEVNIVSTDGDTAFAEADKRNQEEIIKLLNGNHDRFH